MICRLKIGPVTYRVVEMADTHMIGTSSDGSGRAVALSGAIAYHDLTISVAQSNAPEMKLVTLWHEAIHGILKAAGQDHSENVVEALSFGLVALIRDNPELVDLTRKLGDGQVQS